MRQDWLLEYRKNVTSQFGEDGIIEKIFEIVGVTTHWCVELGALNGVHDSNVWSLITQKEWNGVLIEADRSYFEKLVATYASFPRAYPLNAFVSFEGERSLDALFATTPLPRAFDLLSLDIDGNDYHLWDSLAIYTPRVVVIEFNPSIPDDIGFIQPRDMSVFQGSSLRSIVELGKRKGYELVAVNEGNAFFVLRELFPQFSITNNSIEALHTDHSLETKIFQLYDGTIRLEGNRRLIWHGIAMDEERMQPLPRRNRRYPARIDERGSVRSFKYWVRKQPWYPFVQRARKAFAL